MLLNKKYMKSFYNRTKDGCLTMENTSLLRAFSPWIPSAITFRRILLLFVCTQTAKDVLHSYSFTTVCPWPRPIGRSRTSKHPAL